MRVSQIISKRWFGILLIIILTLIITQLSTDHPQITGHPVVGASFQILSIFGPAWSNPSTSFDSIEIDEVGNFSVQWSDDKGLSYFIFSTNETGSWVNGTAQFFNTTSNRASALYTITQSEGTFGWKFYANDSDDNWNVTSDQMVTIGPGDVSPPTFSNNRTNFSTLAFQETGNFSVLWSDDVALSHSIFSVKTVAEWTNYTAQAFVSGTTQATVSALFFNPIRGPQIQWRFYANDTTGKWNETGIQHVNIVTRPSLDLGGSGPRNINRPGEIVDKSVDENVPKIEPDQPGLPKQSVQPSNVRTAAIEENEVIQKLPGIGLAFEFATPRALPYRMQVTEGLLDNRKDFSAEVVEHAIKTLAAYEEESIAQEESILTSLTDESVREFSQPISIIESSNVFIHDERGRRITLSPVHLVRLRESDVFVDVEFSPTDVSVVENIKIYSLHSSKILDPLLLIQDVALDASYPQFEALIGVVPLTFEFSHAEIVTEEICCKEEYFVLKCLDWDKVRGICTDPSQWNIVDDVSEGLNRLRLQLSPEDPGYAIGAPGGVEIRTSTINTAGCEEEWHCGPWSAYNEQKKRTRSCIDTSICGTEEYKPDENQICPYARAEDSWHYPLSVLLEYIWNSGAWVLLLLLGGFAYRTYSR